MLIRRNSVKIILENSAAICFVLAGVFSLISPIIAQPTSFRDYAPGVRKYYSQEHQEEIDKLTQRIKSDNRNVALYKARIQLYTELLELNFDNSNWTVYADKLEADLSRLVELEGTAEAFLWRGGWLQSRLLYSFPIHFSQPPKKLTELYPHNRYIDGATSDYMEALRRISDSAELQSVYTNLSILYSTRPQKLVSAPNFPKWRKRVRLKLILADFDNAIKYSRKALEVGAKLPYADGLKQNLAGTYQTSAEVAFKLGADKTAVGFYEEGQNYLSSRESSKHVHECAYYAGWGKVYLKLKKFDKAIETFDTALIPITDDVNCAVVLEKRGDIYNRQLS